MGGANEIFCIAIAKLFVSLGVTEVDERVQVIDRNVVFPICQRGYRGIQFSRQRRANPLGSHQIRDLTFQIRDGVCGRLGGFARVAHAVVVGVRLVRVGDGWAVVRDIGDRIAIAVWETIAFRYRTRTGAVRTVGQSVGAEAPVLATYVPVGAVKQAVIESEPVLGL